MFTLKSGSKLAERPEFCSVGQFSLINACELGNFSEKCAAYSDGANLGETSSLLQFTCNFTDLHNASHQPKTRRLTLFRDLNQCLFRTARL